MKLIRSTTNTPTLSNVCKKLLTISRSKSLKYGPSNTPYATTPNKKAGLEKNNLAVSQKADYFQKSL